MNKTKLILTSAVLALMLASCGGNNNNDTSVSPSPSPAATDNANGGGMNDANGTQNGVEKMMDDMDNTVTDAGDAMGNAVKDMTGNK